MEEGESESPGYEVTATDHINKSMLETFKRLLEANEVPLANAVMQEPDEDEGWGKDDSNDNNEPEGPK